MNHPDKRLIVLPSVLAVTDVGVTLAGQPSGYWEGDLSMAVDANPLVELALRTSPLLAIPASLAWVGMIWWAMIRFPPPWRRGVYTFLCLGHLTFVWAWIYQWSATIGILFLSIAIGVVRVMHHQLHADRNPSR